MVQVKVMTPAQAVVWAEEVKSFVERRVFVLFAVQSRRAGFGCRSSFLLRYCMD